MTIIQRQGIGTCGNHLPMMYFLSWSSPESHGDREHSRDFGIVVMTNCQSGIIIPKVTSLTWNRQMGLENYPNAYGAPRDPTIFGSKEAFCAFGRTNKTLLTFFAITWKGTKVSLENQLPPRNLVRWNLVKTCWKPGEISKTWWKPGENLVKFLKPCENPVKLIEETFYTVKFHQKKHGLIFCDIYPFSAVKLKAKRKPAENLVKFRKLVKNRWNLRNLVITLQRWPGQAFPRL